MFRSLNAGMAARNEVLLFSGWLHRIKLITCGGIHFTITPFLNLDGRDSHFALSPSSPLDSCRTSGALPPPPSSAPYSFRWDHLAEDVPVCGCRTVHSSHDPGFPYSAVTHPLMSSYLLISSPYQCSTTLVLRSISKICRVDTSRFSYLISSSLTTKLRYFSWKSYLVFFNVVVSSTVGSRFRY